MGKPPRSGRSWADLEDANTEEGGPDAPEGGPAASDKDDRAARKVIMVDRDQVAIPGICTDAGEAKARAWCITFHKAGGQTLCLLRPLR